MVEDDTFHHDKNFWKKKQVKIISAESIYIENYASEQFKKEEIIIIIIQL